MLLLDHFCSSFDRVVTIDIDLQQLHTSREIPGIKVLHGGFTLFDGTTSEEDMGGGICEELRG
jgi:hypothetical protein